ncbi:tetratricopeptide repeat protein [Streptomyces sp. 2R]|uniref:tetratricopeptide repeat protein n=1 Tax=Streptomyces sp. 2R TaxID=1883452 RepID=UPI000B919BCE|nr:tetratricopeptide repeat protein [Streptomyces sp. 2R]OXY96373.1 hypothetical protein BEH93_33665 [Streptomyces sp. 2R]
MVTILVAMVTNYVTADPPKWTENNPAVWSLFGALAVVSIGLLFWERHLTDAVAAEGRPPVALERIAAANSHSMNPPTVFTPVRGRTEELARLSELVSGPGSGLVVVCGAGGLGKTTVAAEAAAQARAEGRVVVWIRWRDDPAQLAQDLTHAAHTLGMPEGPLEEARTGRASLVDAVWDHLSAVTGWLIVIDNVDTPAHIGPGVEPIAAYRGWLRPHGSGTLLITSRDTSTQTWGPDAVLMPLNPLADEAGATVLLDSAPHAGTNSEAEALAMRLGGLPLALNAAGTYLAVPTSRHKAFTAYCRALEEEFDDLLGAERPGAVRGAETSRQVVRHTWDLSLDQLHQDGYTLARPILQLLALFEPAPIPRALITPSLVADTTGLQATAATVDTALAGLHQYGLLNTPQHANGETHEETVGQLQLHPLVREVTAHTLSRPQPTNSWLTAIDQHLAQFVTTTTGIPGRAGWPTARLLAPHVLPFLDRATLQNFPTACEILGDLAYALRAAGAASEQVLLCQHMLAAAAVHLGHEHPDTLIGRNNLAESLRGLGEYQQAADLHRQTLTDRERILGPEHADTLSSRNNLAGCLNSLGDHQQAAHLHRQNLGDTERVLGPEHPHTLNSRNNLADSLNSLGEHQQAADLHQQTLTDRERLLGLEHPNTLTSRSGLAESLRGLGNYQQAADLHRQTLTERQRILGPEHPHTLNSRNNLAESLQGLGDYQQAADLHRQTLTDRERILGPEHPHTLNSRNNLATVETALANASSRRPWLLWRR